MTKSLLTFLTICSISILSAIAQHFPMVHYGVEDGLPSNTVYDIYRDSRGFLWIATDKGVVRYNGIKFEKFTTANGLPDNETFATQEDDYGRIWMAPYNGQLCFYQDEKFHTALNTPYLRLPFEIANFANGIKTEKDSTVTIWMFGSPNILNVYNDHIVVHNINNDFNYNLLSTSQFNIDTLNYSRYRFISASKINDSVYEVAYGGQIIDVDKHNRIFKQRPTMYNKGIGRCFSQEKEWLYDDSMIYNRCNEPVKAWPDIVKINKRAQSKNFRIYNYKNEFYYISDSGLYNDTSLLFKKKNISSITQDRSGNYWLSTRDDGIFYMDKYYYKNSLNNNIYSGDIKYSCVRNGKLFYITNNNNVYYYNNGNPECLYNFQKIVGKSGYYHPTSPGYLLDSNYRLYYFYGNYHVVVENVLDAKCRQTRHRTYKVDGIKSVFRNKDLIYFNDPFEIMKVDYSVLKRGAILDYNLQYCKDPSNTYRIFCSAQSTDGNVWYSTTNKIYKIIDTQSILQSQFTGFSFKRFDLLGEYLIGCSNNKLYICNHFDSNIIIDSIVDQNCIWDKFHRIDSNRLLISTENKYRLVTVHYSDGRPQYEILTIENPVVPLRAQSICSDGKKCYFFKNGAITTIDVKTLLMPSENPTLYFSTLKIGDEVTAVKNEYTIPFDRNKNIVLSFLTVSFSAKNISYQYSISKNETDTWNGINDEDINIVNPDYGNYIIKVRAKTQSGDYSIPIMFTLHITKPYWATWWFISLGVLVFGGTVVVLVRQRVSFVIAKKEKAHDDKVKFMKSEYKALNALMNPHFIFNTLNNVQSLVNGNDKLAANEYLRVFADLVRQNMHNVSKELIPLQKEIELIINYLSLEKLRFEDKLNYKINIDDDLELYDIMIPPLLIQPLVENSIKHGILPLKTRSGFIEINIREQRDVLVIEVKDNGVGLNNSEEKAGSLHESFGLDNIRKRIEQLSIIQGKEITFSMGQVTDDQDIRWTTVTVTMQL